MSARYTVLDGEVLAQERGGVRHQLLPDPLGSVVALYNDAGVKTDAFEYWPYGESAGRTGTTATPFQFVGTMGYYTDSSGKSYVRARYLDKSKGRWVTEDPIGFDGGDWNTHLYVAACPVTFTDRSGLACEGGKCSSMDELECQISCHLAGYAYSLTTCKCIETWKYPCRVGWKIKINTIYRRACKCKGARKCTLVGSTVFGDIKYCNYSCGVGPFPVRTDVIVPIPFPRNKKCPATINLDQNKTAGDLLDQGIDLMKEL